MNALVDFHFLRPLCLLLLVPFLLVCWRLFRRADAAGVWQSVCDDALLPYLLVQGKAVRSPLNPALFLLGGCIAIVALAGPTWERLPTPVFRDESALVLLLDLSRSMNAEDVSPTRLERAKYKITDILRLRRDGQTALIVYAAEPYVVAPLTTDVATIESHLPSLKTNIMPSQGSDSAAAIEKGLELLQQAGNASGDLLLITDGVGLDEGHRARTAIDGSPARLSILGVGTADGAPIPDKSGGFVTDAAGAIVVNALDSAALETLAAAGGGRYTTLRTDDSDVDQLLGEISQQHDERNARSTDLFADRWREFGPWLLLALLPFAPLAFRRGILMFAGLAVSLTLLPATPAAAGWWRTPDQSAQSEFDDGNYAAAAETFADPSWRAAASYRANDFTGAVENIGEGADPETQYNKGNALARLGRFEEAIEAYETTLAALPDHADAQHNKKLLEELLKEQQQQEQSESDSSDDNESEDQSGESGGDQSSQHSDAKPSDSESEDSAQADPGAEEQSASTTSAEQESAAETQPDEQEQTAEEQQAEAEEAPAEKAEDAFAAANSELENEQATEQWLRQIPDDPGGLLRRKFEAEYQRKYGGERRSRAW
jgi:Ca-activated chloride channel family protein